MSLDYVGSRGHKYTGVRGEGLGEGSGLQPVTMLMSEGYASHPAGARPIWMARPVNLSRDIIPTRAAAKGGVCICGPVQPAFLLMSVAPETMQEWAVLGYHLEPCWYARAMLLWLRSCQYGGRHCHLGP